MIAALIGDLAAWTWEHNRECFYRKLVSENAEFSGYSLLALSLWPIVNEGGLLHKGRTYQKLRDALANPPRCCKVKTEWGQWASSPYDTPLPFNLKIGFISSAFIDSAFLPLERQGQLNWVSFFHGGKQEYYASYITTIIRRLREGATKDEAIKDIPQCVFDYYHSCEPHPWHDYLEYITFAWRCFYYSFDFTSALHNAMKCTANRHLAAFLTGAFAEAMYGCDYSMTKKRFGGNYEWIAFPKSIIDVYGQEIHSIREREHNERIFFSKNDALANVERYAWTPVENPYKDFTVNSELRRRMMKAYDTGWEHRYGIYLDNGWFYIYRSHCVLYRFRLKEISPGEWRISDLQVSNDEHVAHGEYRFVELKSVMDCLESYWFKNLGPYMAGDESGPENLKFCKYYHGETQLPKGFSPDSIESKFWHGEKMFIESGQSIDHWRKYGEKVKSSLSQDKLRRLSDYSPETIGIILYIETLYSKWCPYDTLDWIYEY